MDLKQICKKFVEVDLCDNYEFEIRSDLAKRVL